VVTTIAVNERGCMTLPKAMRKTIGIEQGGVVMVEVQGNAIFIRPAVAFPVELYSDERVAEFDEADKELAGHLKNRKRK
jgi:AbrB family looped-hinge helix DNA binding protein